VTVRDVTIHGSNRGVGFQQRAGCGSMRDMLFENLTIDTSYPTGANWWGSGEPIWLTSVPESDGVNDR
jgi:hypothetical protein